jgi:DNA-binding CsgD family transcriptional regulator
MRRAALDVIEAAYHTEGSTAEWLRQIAKAIPKPRGARGHLCITYSIEPSGRLAFDAFEQVDTPEDIEAPCRASMQAMSPEMVRATWASIPSGTALSSGPIEAREFSRAGMAAAVGDIGVRDMFIVNGIDPTHQGIYIGTLAAQEIKLSRRERGTWSRVAAHLVASYRLRRARGQEPDAVISPDGKIEHAIDDAKTTSAREALRTAALAIDRARARRTSIDEDEAVDMWHALVSGRWTLVDQIDSDGKRHFVARKNDPEVARHHKLTQRERQVVGFAALGHPNKLIAYELGLSISAVAVYLDIAIDKLGLSSRAELIVAARAFDAV